MSNKFSIEEIRAARDASKNGDCDNSKVRAQCPKCRFADSLPEMVDVLLAEIDARPFPSEADKKLLGLAIERLDDGSAWADESEEFRDLKSLIERLNQ